MTHPQTLWKTQMKMVKIGVKVHLQHFGGKKGMLKLQDRDYNEWQANQLFIWIYTN
jgi:hypothetical protein